MARVFPDEAQFFRDQAAEAAMSRLWGGIHFAHDNNQGLLCGKQVGQRAARTMRHGFGPGPIASNREDDD
jgi:hypothetical protein